MKLFEGGILEKITNDEYENMIRSMKDVTSPSEDVNAIDEQKAQETKINGRGISTNTKAKITSEKELTALNLRMLQGAFYVIFLGHILATVVLILEIVECHKAAREFVKTSITFLRLKIYHASTRLCEIKACISRSPYGRN